MSGCNQNCNQGRNCNCQGELNMEYKSDMWVKIVLVLAALYFLGHIVSAVAQSAPPPPVVQCWTNGMGTIQCIQI